MGAFARALKNSQLTARTSPLFGDGALFPYPQYKIERGHSSGFCCLILTSNSGLNNQCRFVPPLESTTGQYGTVSREAGVVVPGPSDTARKNCFQRVRPLESEN